jgi:hypothetical protein
MARYHHRNRAAPCRAPHLPTVKMLTCLLAYTSHWLGLRSSEEFPSCGKQLFLSHLY